MLLCLVNQSFDHRLDLVGKVLASRRLQKASVVLDRHHLCAASVQLNASGSDDAAKLRIREQGLQREAGSTF